MKASTSSSLSGPVVWLLTEAYPLEADDINRETCHVNANGLGAIRLDFLDLSYYGDMRSPYCVYWGASDFVCARQASERQTFEIRTSSNSQNTPQTLLFWSNNDTETTAARFWIEIRGSIKNRKFSSVWIKEE